MDPALCPTNEIISASLASVPRHNTKMPISLSSHPATPFLFHSLPHTYRHRGLAQEIHCMLPLSFSHGYLNTYYGHVYTNTHTHVMDTHTHTTRTREWERDPKHQNSINPLRRSLKGFLKADFQHTEVFQVSTVCGGSGAEAFKLYAFTFSTLLLPISSSLSLSHIFLFQTLLLFSFSTFVLHLCWDCVHTGWI